MVIRFFLKHPNVYIGKIYADVNKNWVYLMSTTTTFQNHVEKRIKEMREREKRFRSQRKN